jgi:nicotinamidase-related amidase
MGASVALGMSARVGLAELLEGKARLADTIISDVASGTDLIVPGRFSRASLIAWIGNLAGLIESLRNQYDIVIIDSPPVFSVPEATLLASHADATILALRWGNTPREAARSALRKLRDSGASLAGSVMTMVHERQRAKYGYTEVTYSGKNAKYGLPIGAAARSGIRTSGNPSWSGFSTLSANLAAGCRELVDRAMPSRPLGHPHGPVRRKNDPSAHALLVLDIRENLSRPQGRHALPYGAGDRLIGTINNLSQLATRSGMMVLHAYQKGAAGDGKAFARLRGAANDRKIGSHPDKRLKLVGANIFQNRGGNAFSNAEFEEFLREKGITHLFLAGADAVTSISLTARTALDKGYRVTFIRDGIFTADEGKWERLLDSFESAAAFAITSGEFAEYAMALRQSAERESEYSVQS